MDVFLSKVTQQAMNYAIRSGITITASYAIRESSRLLKNVNGADRAELQSLQQRLQSKIRIISPAIDMIELIAARGNTSLESAVTLTKTLRHDIQELGQQLAKTASKEELCRKGALSSRERSQVDSDIKQIIKQIRDVLDRIEDAVPLINLAITTSGASLSTTLPSTVSPSRLLQASTFLTAGDTQYSMSPGQAIQVGPTFTLSLYMLFASHVRSQDEESVRNTTWKEVIHKARVKLRRVPMDMIFSDATGHLPQGSHMRAEARADEFAYQIMIVEDLDDDRVHTFEDGVQKPEAYEDVALAGIREFIPVHQISKIFYADTGKILNIGTEGEINNPVLLLKRDVNAIPPRRMMDSNDFQYDDAEEEEGSEQSENAEQSQLDSQLYSEQPSPRSPQETSGGAHERWRFPPNLDPEWIAFEVYNETEDSDSESEAEPSPSPKNSPRRQSTDQQLNERMTNLRINEKTKQSSPSPAPSPRHNLTIPSPSPQNPQIPTVSNPIFNNIRTSLSLLETLLRLTSLQQFQQQSHLSITDELLNFFLEESSTTGAGGDENHRQRVRAEARRKVGWDPYDESPLKRRGEEYQYRRGSGDWGDDENSPEPGEWDSPVGYGTPQTTQSGIGSSSRRQRVSATMSPESPASPSTRVAELRRQVPRRSESSPLARPRTGQTDEGIGTSPGSARGSKGRKSSGAHEGAEGD